MADALAAVISDKTTEAVRSVVPASQAVAHSDKKFVSYGYKIHNEVTYRVIDWLLNSTVGVSMAYWANRKESGEKYFTRPSKWVFNQTLGRLFKNQPKAAGFFVDFLSIMVGGFTIIPPMLFMEDKKHKKSIVQWLDQKLYGKEAVQSDPKFAESYAKIDQEPQKSFLVGMTSRFIALAPLLTLHVKQNTNRHLANYLYDPFASGTKWISKKMGIQPVSMMSAQTMRDGKSNWDFLHYLIGMDFGLTFLYAFLHEATYKALAAFGVKQQKSPVKASSPLPVAETQTEEKATNWTGSISAANKAGPEKASRPEKTLNHKQMVENRAGAEQLGIA